MQEYAEESPPEARPAIFRGLCQHTTGGVHEKGHQGSLREGKKRRDQGFHRCKPGTDNKIPITDRLIVKSIRHLPEIRPAKEPRTGNSDSRSES